VTPLSQSRPKDLRMARRAEARRAMSLAELVCAVAIIGLLATMAVTRYGSSTVADVGADGFARRLALDCLQARRAAISTGNNHLLRFTLSGGKATQYAMFRRQGANVTQVDDARAVPKDVSVTTGGIVDMEFNFAGEALAGYTIACAAPDRTRMVVVPQITGKAFVE
jgi:prepilin-type N-terminal cleavage/methylation domain-containing protein